MAYGGNVWLVCPLTWWRVDIIMGNGSVDLITPNDGERTAIYVDGGGQRTACHDEDGMRMMAKGKNKALNAPTDGSAVFRKIDAEDSRWDCGPPKG
jgi:hypothetical protein